MKVKELIEELKKCDPEKPVVMSSDAEGNYYNYLHEIDDNSAYCRETHSIGIEILTPEYKDLGYDKSDVYEDGEPCVCICPG